MTESAEINGLGPAKARPSNSRLYPWYDSVWLSQYEVAKAIVREARPDALASFVDAFRVLHTRPDFKVKFLEQPFDDATFAENQMHHEYVAAQRSGTALERLVSQ